MKTFRGLPRESKYGTWSSRNRIFFSGEHGEHEYIGVLARFETFQNLSLGPLVILNVPREALLSRLSDYRLPPLNFRLPAPPAECR